MNTRLSAAVHSVHRFTFTVPDLKEAERFYTCFGLDVRREGDRLHLRTFGHPHVWAHVLQGGERKRLQHVAYGSHAEDVPTFAEAGIGSAEPLARQVLLLLDGSFAVTLLQRDPTYMDAAGDAARVLVGTALRQVRGRRPIEESNQLSLKLDNKSSR